MDVVSSYFANTFNHCVQWLHSCTKQVRTTEAGRRVGVWTHRECTHLEFFSPIILNHNHPLNQTYTPPPPLSWPTHTHLHLSCLWAIYWSMINHCGINFAEAAKTCQPVLQRCLFGGCTCQSYKHTCAHPRVQTVSHGDYCTTHLLS